MNIMITILYLNVNNNDMKSSSYFYKKKNYISISSDHNVILQYYVMHKYRYWNKSTYNNKHVNNYITFWFEQ